MTEPERPQPYETAETATSAQDIDDAAEAPEPEPEPWTPERVLDWNAYYDIYVSLGVLLLVFIVSAHRITHSSIWTHLQTGRLIAANSTPVMTDPFSYTEAGKPWVNIPWLFQWGYAQAYKAAYDLMPVDRNDPAGSAAGAEQVGAGTLVAINALVRTLMVVFLLKIRRPGPGLWWVALCALLGMGVVWSPAGVALGGLVSGVVLGGIGGVGQVDAASWGGLLLAVELYLLHRAINLGAGKAAYALIPLFLLWANVDESFLIGLLVLAAIEIGLAVDAGEESLAIGPGRGLAILAACAAVCLANPSFYRIYPAALEPLLAVFRPEGGLLTIDQLSYFGPRIRQPDQAGPNWVYLASFYLIVVGIGLAGFLLNRRRFRLGRFLVYALTALLWGVYIRYGSEFAIVFVATLALNGQEWYLDRVGARGRLGRGWALWSVGGRAVTIVLIFLCVAKGLTGWRNSPGDAQFGFGFRPDEFSFEAAEYLRTAPIRGNVLNTSLQQGDSLIWRAYPLRKTFIDGRPHLFSSEIRNEFEEVRLALRDDDVERWKPILDKHEISAVMIQESASPNTYRRLIQSPNWIPFYDDGNAILFGRADAPEADLAHFKADRLEADALAYERTRPFPSFDRAPTPVGWMDEIFQHRSLARPQAHTEASRRWLMGAGADANVATIPDPARCLVAIREARLALARRPDDTRAFRLLATAYRFLMAEESALLTGQALTPENLEQAVRTPDQTQMLMNRFRQRVTALNFAIQTTPPPRTPEERAEFQGLHLELFQLFGSVNFVDLARDHLQAAFRLFSPGDAASSDARAQMATQLAQLDERVKEVETQMADLSIEQQAGPLQRANFALGQGMPGLAIRELEEAEQQLAGAAPGVVKPQLLDLYCDTGQPEKALDLLAGVTEANDPSLGAEPGAAALRQGRVHLLLGNYEFAATFWVQQAIPQIRYDLGRIGPATTQLFLRGNVKVATNELLSVPRKVGLEAGIENEAGLCLLEAGQPQAAAEHLSQALTLDPKLPTRAVTAYYLEKLGKPVPPAPAEGATAAPSSSTTPAAETSPEAGGPPAGPAPAADGAANPSTPGPEAAPTPDATPAPSAPQPAPAAPAEESPKGEPAPSKPEGPKP